MKNHRSPGEQRVRAHQITRITPLACSFTVLYECYLDKVYRTCLSFTNDTQAAQDYTQDIFLKAFDRLDSFAQQSSFSTWLYAIAHNHCRDQYRLGKRLPTESISADLIQTLGGDSSSFADDADEDRLRLLERQLARLTPLDEDLLRLRYERGLSVVALSQHYQLSESAVKMRLKRSRDRLRSLCVREADE